MTNSDLINESIRAILSNKVRSVLTILGIIIGIGSVIAMVSIGKGAQGSIESSIESIGSNLIVVMPGFSRNTGGARASRGSAVTLTYEDAKAIEKELDLAAAVAPESSRNYQIKAGANNTNSRVVGTVAEYLVVRNIEIQNGIFISEQHLNLNSKIAVIGPTTRDDLFGVDSDPIGKKIRINNIDFSIVGITKSKGSSGFNNSDDVIYVPLTTAQTFLSRDKFVSNIGIQAEDKESMSQLQQDVTDLLLARHKIFNQEDVDFSVVNQADIVEAASNITNTFTVLLASIAGISLLVGGIGIMNMMLTSVTERTREIGLRKAIGATRSDINKQFLFEAVVITFIGGILGILLGWLISVVISKIFSTPTTVSTYSIILATSISVLIGIIFGYYPARKAAQLNPIDALRYE